MTIADRCRMDPDRLREMIKNPKKRRGSLVKQAPTLPMPQKGSDHVEDQAITLYMAGDESVIEILSEDLFVAPMRKEMYLAVREAPSVREAVDMLGSDEGGLLIELAASSDDELNAQAVLSRLVGRAADRLARDIEAEMRLGGDIEALNADVKYLRQWVIDLREPSTDLNDLAPLAEWISMRGQTNSNENSDSAVNDSAESLT